MDWLSNIWTVTAGLWDQANDFVRPWLDKYHIFHEAPVVVAFGLVAAVAAGGWSIFVAGPAKRRKTREAETRYTQTAKTQTTLLETTAAATVSAADASAERDAATQDKVDQVLALLKSKAEPGAAFDATTEEGLRATLANLLDAQSGARKRAGDKLLAGDRDGAINELKQFAAHENQAVARAAETQKEIGALAFPDRTQDAIEAYERAAQLAPADLEARNQLGHLYLRVGRLNEAYAAYQGILDAANVNEGWQAAALDHLGIVARTRGDLEAAEAYLKRSLAMNETLGSLEGQAAALGNLGLVARTRGDLDAAEAYHKRSLAMNETLGSLKGQAAALGNLGLVAQTRGDLEAAEAYLKRALAMNETLGRLEGQANQLGNLGLVAGTRYDLDAAEAYHKRSLAMNETLGRLEGQANQLGNLGLVAGTRGDLDAAEAYLKRALAMNETLGSLEGQANQLGNLGAVAGTRGDLDAAKAYWRQALALYRNIGIPHMVEKISGRLRDIGDDPNAPPA